LLPSIKLKFFIITICITTISCTVQDYIPQSDAESIRRGSTVVCGWRNEEPEVIFNQFLDLILTRGYRVSTIDREIMIINTDEKNIGHETIARLNVHIKRHKQQTQIIVSTDWAPSAAAQYAYSVISGGSTSSHWTTAKWRDGGRHDLAFANTVKLMQQFTDLISYW